MWEHSTFDTFEPSIFMTSVHPPPPHASSICLVMWQYTGIFLDPTSSKYALFPLDLIKHTTSLVHFILGYFAYMGLEKAVLIRAPWQLRISEKKLSALSKRHHMSCEWIARFNLTIWLTLSLLTFVIGRTVFYRQFCFFVLLLFRQLLVSRLT